MQRLPTIMLPRVPQGTRVTLGAEHLSFLEASATSSVSPAKRVWHYDFTSTLNGRASTGHYFRLLLSPCWLDLVFFHLSFSTPPSVQALLLQGCAAHCNKSTVPWYVRNARLKCTSFSLAFVESVTLSSNRSMRLDPPCFSGALRYTLTSLSRAVRTQTERDTCFTQEEWEKATSDTSKEKIFDKRGGKSKSTESPSNDIFQLHSRCSFWHFLQLRTALYQDEIVFRPMNCLNKNLFNQYQFFRIHAIQVNHSFVLFCCSRWRGRFFLVWNFFSVKKHVLCLTRFNEQPRVPHQTASWLNSWPL